MLRLRWSRQALQPSRSSTRTPSRERRASTRRPVTRRRQLCATPRSARWSRIAESRPRRSRTATRWVRRAAGMAGAPARTSGAGAAVAAARGRSGDLELLVPVRPKTATQQVSTATSSGPGPSPGSSARLARQFRAGLAREHERPDGRAARLERAERGERLERAEPREQFERTEPRVVRLGLRREQQRTRLAPLGKRVRLLRIRLGFVGLGRRRAQRVGRVRIL